MKADYENCYSRWTLDLQMAGEVLNGFSSRKKILECKSANHKLPVLELYAAGKRTIVCRYITNILQVTKPQVAVCYPQAADTRTICYEYTNHRLPVRESYIADRRTKNC